MLKKMMTAALIGTVLWFPAAGLASDFGCQVLLCLAGSSQGEVRECRPILKKLWERLLDGHSFPSCDFVSADPQMPQSNIEVQHGREYYKPCRSGYEMGYYEDESGEWSKVHNPRRFSHWGQTIECRRFIRYEEDVEGNRWPVYSSYPAERYINDRYVKVLIDGQQHGETWRYRVR